MSKVSINNFKQAVTFRKQHSILKNHRIGSKTDLDLVIACFLVDNDPE